MILVVCYISNSSLDDFNLCRNIARRQEKQNKKDIFLCASAQFLKRYKTGLNKLSNINRSGFAFSGTYGIFLKFHKRKLDLRALLK